MELRSPVTSLKGVGSSLASKLMKMGIVTIYDLLTHYPRAYEGKMEIIPVSQAVRAGLSGGPVTVELTIADGPAQRFVKGYRIISATGKDDGGALPMQWFNQPYLMKTIKKDGTYIFRGNLKARGSSFYLSNPKLISREHYEQMNDSLLPVYSLTKGVSAATLQKLIRQALSELTLIDDYIAADPFFDGGEGRSMPGLSEAINGIHFPGDRDEAMSARKRLVFDEFLLFMLNVRLMQENGRDRNNCVIKKNDRVQKLLDSLPYELTGAQKRTIDEIYSDIGGEYIMNRLVQGDVGSGKTIVAFAAMLTAALSGYQAVLMAPTEVLARQHFEQLSVLVSENGFEELRCVLLTGSLTEKEKRLAREAIADGSADLIVGTHALIFDSVTYKNPGLVVTDEQHRFGVKQRMKLSRSGKADEEEGKQRSEAEADGAGGKLKSAAEADGSEGKQRSAAEAEDHEGAGMVHTLVMSATPIPRTLAIILYGDLDISLMDELPAKRLPIKNCVVGPSYRKKACEFIEKQVREGRQALVICPMVEESESLDVENVTDYTEKLRQSLPSDINIELLHGRMKGSEKNEIMERFADGTVQVLVSTTVVEVGINVPNTTVMMVENAERFGLAQLHQLRGRVGRGEHQSYCIFMCTSEGKDAKERLDILSKSNDGFKIAEEDLRQRGPGDMFGYRQSGEMDFKLGDIYTDSETLKLAAEYASAAIANRGTEKENRALFELLDQKKLYNAVSL